MDNRHICVLDFETGSKFKNSCEVLQIGACIINSSNLTIVDEFNSMMQPLNWDALEDEALGINKITREQLREAPLPSVIFPAFCEWIKKYNTKKGTFGAPTPAGWNIINFDIPIMERYCKEYGYWDNKWNNQSVLNPVFSFDAGQHMWAWTRRLTEPQNLKLTTVLEWMGVPKEEIEGAHNAVWDVKWTAQIIIRLLRMMEWLTTDIKDGCGTPRLVFKNSLEVS